MKTKNLIISIIALFTGFLSAYADAFATTAFVKVRYSTQPPGGFTCTNTGLHCNDLSTIMCLVAIDDLSGALAPARRNATCPTPDLFHSLNGGVIGSYDDDATIVQIVN